MDRKSREEDALDMPAAPPITNCFGVRGATTVDNNDKEEILAATRELLYIMVKANNIPSTAVASVYFSVTSDLNAVFPATAARQLGWYEVALICSNEIAVPGALPRCIRVMLHWNTVKRQDEITHVYLRKAQSLRPDRTELPEIPIEELEAAVKGTLSQIDIPT